MEQKTRNAARQCAPSLIGALQLDTVIIEPVIMIIVQLFMYWS